MASRRPDIPERSTPSMRDHNANRFGARIDPMGIPRSAWLLLVRIRAMHEHHHDPHDAMNSIMGSLRVRVRPVRPIHASRRRSISTTSVILGRRQDFPAAVRGRNGPDRRGPRDGSGVRRARSWELAGWEGGGSAVAAGAPRSPARFQARNATFRGEFKRGDELYFYD